MPLREPDGEVMEDLIARMAQSLEGAGAYNPSDGVNAALNFAYRMVQVLIRLSVSHEERLFNASTASTILRQMAERIDLEMLQTKREVVH